MSHRKGIYDTDLHFVIDPVTRTIRNESGKVTIIQYDHNSERFTFEVPRYIDGHDMAECNRVEVHYNNIATGQTNKGLYEVTDLQVSPDDSRYVTCSWLISQNATRLVGRLAFVVRFECVKLEGEEVGEVDYAWNTSPYGEIKIVSGIYNTEEVVYEYADVLAQWKQDLIDAGIIDRIEQTITATDDNAVNELTVYMTDKTEYKFEVRNGSRGPRGYSNYEIAVQHGYEGTEEEWNAAVNEARTRAETAAANAKVSETNAATSEANAKASELASKDSETKSKVSEEASKQSELNAKESELASKDSETKSKESEDASKQSELNAKESEEASKQSELNAKESEEASKQSELNSKESELASKDSEVNSKASEEASKQSELNSKASEEASKQSEIEAGNQATIATNHANAAAESEAKSLEHATNAATSETNAKASEETAVVAAENSANSATNAATSELNAANSETNAAESERNAAQSADSANSSAQAAASSAEEAKTNADNLNADLIQAQLNLKADNLWFDPETNLLYLMSGGEIVGDGVAVATSGGGVGGGSSTDYTITLKNLLDNRVFSLPAGSKVELKFTYSSVDDEGYNDGSGVGTITVNNAKKGTVSVTQGENTVDISNYLTSGTNTVKISVANSEGNSKSLSYTITMITLTLSTTLENFSTQTGDLTLYYTPVGNGVKTVYFYMDGEKLGTQTVTSSGKSQSYVIPTQSHGGHFLEVYATMMSEDILITSEPLKKAIIWVNSENMTPIILIDYDVTEAVQGETLNIPYIVYDPAHETTAITLSVLNEDGSVYSEKPLTVGRTPQNWVVQDYPIGNVKFKISYGTTSESKIIAVTKSSIVFETITDSLVLDVNPAGRSNQEDNPATWTDGNVTATFSNIGFSGADGWLTDSVGSPMLRILPGGEMTIPYQLFAADRRDSGLTVEVEMSTNNVRDYDSVVLSCLSGGRGFKVASQYAQLSSEQSSISMQFKEEDRVRLSFVVEPKALNRLIYVYVDGIMCGCLMYPEDDNFQQNPATGLIIGAESSGIDIYRILMYTKGLTRNEIVDNFIAGRATLQQRLATNARNNVLNLAEEIVISQLPATLPYMIIACPELPQFKDDKKDCTITYVNPADISKSFYAENVQIDVQGTSSAGYKKKNFKPKFKGGFTLTANGEYVEKYALNSNAIPVSVFCLKADVASSEGANNVELVRFYNDVCPYKTPPQVADSRVRWGIDGHPIVVFHDDGTNTKFVGKYTLPTLNSL